MGSLPPPLPPLAMVCEPHPRCPRPCPLSRVRPRPWRSAQRRRSRCPPRPVQPHSNPFRLSACARYCSAARANRVLVYAARTLKHHRSIPGHAIAAVRALKSSLLATAGGKRPEIRCPKNDGTTRAGRAHRGAGGDPAIGRGLPRPAAAHGPSPAHPLGTRHTPPPHGPAIHHEDATTPS